MIQTSTYLCSSNFTSQVKRLYGVLFQVFIGLVALPVVEFI